ncbi:MAG: DUF3887 domain-containing protein [Lachnospiraceae bacterium]|nr:DUF3887 domain-containing protein [Lachnospiraceae bacterium]
MTAKKYVEEVGKLLKCRMAKKKEIKRQLLSEINDAVAKGETVDAVLKRMGIPWDYANQYNDRFDKAEWKAAKGEKAMLIWGIVLLISLLLLGFLYRNLPRWGDIRESTVFQEAQVKEQAMEIIRLYSNDDFEAVNAYMNEDMKVILSAEMLRYTKTEREKDFGTLLKFEDMEISEASQNGKKYAVVQVEVSYSALCVTYSMTFDESMKLAGFHID